MQKKTFNIAIDGPAGAGKSTIARMVAKRLGFIYVDTGAMYRAVALYLLRAGVDLEDEAAVSGAAAGAQITIRHQGGVQQVLLNGEDVSGLIRTQEVSDASSKVSAYPAVRAHLLDLQRRLAAEADVLMDGRDIGTCILPEADTKIFLTASPHVRALRRYKEMVEKGEACNLEEIEQTIIERDERDQNRAVAPLKAAEDAVLLDSSEMTIEQVIQVILNEAAAHGLPGARMQEGGTGWK